MSAKPDMGCIAFTIVRSSLLALRFCSLFLRAGDEPGERNTRDSISLRQRQCKAKG